MKNSLLFIFVNLLFIYSCTTDFDVAGNWEEATIVYGMLNANDTAQYIKVNKAFLDREKGALAVAKNADSLYHKDELKVEIEEWRNESYIKTIPLSKIDGNEDNHIKHEGIFANSPNLLYKTNDIIKTNTKNDQYFYKLIITKKNGETITSQTPIVGGISNVRPTKHLEGNWASETPYSVRWKSAENGIVYELRIRFHYHEIHKVDSTLTTKSLDWFIFSNLHSEDTQGNESMEYKIPTNNLFFFLNANLVVDQTVYRIADSLDLIFYIGGEELDNYIEVNNANTGLTQVQIRPEYTNIQNGLGIFSSRYDTTITGIPFKKAALDSIANGSITSHLGFLPGT